QVLLLVDVHLHELDLMLVGDPVEDGRDGVTRPTPLGPEVDQDLAAGLGDLLLERLGRRVGCHGAVPFLCVTDANAWRGRILPARYDRSHVRALAGQARSSRTRARGARPVGAR